MEILTENNFLIFAAKHYNNPSCKDTEEFIEDINRFKYIKKLITRYISKNELKDRLLLNHLIILHNVFPPVILCRLLYLKLKDYFPYIKPFLIGLSVYQNKIYNVENRGVIDLDHIVMNNEMIKIARGIWKDEEL